MPKVSPKVISVLLLISTICLPATADYREWKFTEVYSIADHTVQYIEMFTTEANQHELAGIKLRSVITSNEYVFPTDLPSSDTANRSILLATAAFPTVPGAVTPDYIIPDDFIAEGDGILFEDDFTSYTSLGYCQPTPAWPGQCIPLDGIHSMDNTKTIQLNSPTNFSGNTGFLNPVDLNNVYVDFDIQFSGNGSPGAPFETMAEAIAAANSAATIFISSGSTPETFLITTPLRLESTGGLVRIGVPAARRVKTGFVSRGSPP